MFETYMRPSRAPPTPVDSAAPAPSEGHRGLLVRVDPSELGRPGKAGEVNTSVALDLPCHQHLAFGRKNYTDSRALKPQSSQ